MRLSFSDKEPINLTDYELDYGRSVNMRPAQYARLVRARAVRDRVFGLIRREHGRSVTMVLKISRRRELLASQRVLAQSIQRRNPYVDPLNSLQIRFLARWRQAGQTRRSEALRRLLALTVHGIAFGMKSTG